MIRVNTYCLYCALGDQTSHRIRASKPAEMSPSNYINYNPGFGSPNTEISLSDMNSVKIYPYWHEIKKCSISSIVAGENSPHPSNSKPYFFYGLAS